MVAAGHKDLLPPAVVAGQGCEPWGRAHTLASGRQPDHSPLLEQWEHWRQQRLLSWVVQDAVKEGSCGCVYSSSLGIGVEQPHIPRVIAVTLQE